MSATGSRMAVCGVPTSAGELSGVDYTFVLRTRGLHCFGSRCEVEIDDHVVGVVDRLLNVVVAHPELRPEIGEAIERGLQDRLRSTFAESSVHSRRALLSRVLVA